MERDGVASMISLEVALETHARTQIIHTLPACYNDCHCVPVARASGVCLLRSDLLQILLDVLTFILTKVVFNTTHFRIKNHGQGLVICDTAHHTVRTPSEKVKSLTLPVIAGSFRAGVVEKFSKVG